MALRILLIDPSESWLNKAMEFFAAKLYEVDIVATGKDAQLKMFQNKYFAVVLNLDVQNHPGIQVMKFIKTNQTTQNVVVTMNKDYFKEGQLTDKDKIRLGALDYLVHPVDLEAIVDKIEGKQSMEQILTNMPQKDGVSDEVEVSQKDEDFTKVPIDEFLSCKVVLFDVYVHLSKDRYVKILHAGDSFSQERVQKYKDEKKVEYLYFMGADRKKYIRYCNYLASKLMGSDKVTTEVKLSLVQNSSEKVVEELFADGVKPVVMEQGKEICQNIYDLIQNDKNLYKMMRSYQEFDPNIYTHAYSVSLFASMVVSQFDWKSKVIQETVSMAGFLHDIGKIKLPKELLAKRPAEMNEQELALYYTHPQRGVEILSGNRLINPFVLQIVEQHHERSDGTGFPKGMKDYKILTLAKILSAVDFFCHLTKEKNLAPVAAIKMMLSDKIIFPKFNPVVMENFLNVFVDPDKIREKDNVPSNSSMVKKAS